MTERIRLEKSFECRDEPFDPDNLSTWPALIISTTIEAGMEYAEILGIKNYIVSNSLEVIQGIRTRAVIPTPGYLSDIERNSWALRHAYNGAIRSFSISTSTWG